MTDCRHGGGHRHRRFTRTLCLLFTAVPHPASGSTLNLGSPNAPIVYSDNTFGVSGALWQSVAFFSSSSPQLNNQEKHRHARPRRYGNDRAGPGDDDNHKGGKGADNNGSQQAQLQARSAPQPKQRPPSVSIFSRLPTFQKDHRQRMLQSQGDGDFCSTLQDEMNADAAAPDDDTASEYQKLLYTCECHDQESTQQDQVDHNDHDNERRLSNRIRARKNNHTQLEFHKSKNTTITREFRPNGVSHILSDIKVASVLPTAICTLEDHENQMDDDSLLCLVGTDGVVFRGTLQAQVDSNDGTTSLCFTYGGTVDFHNPYAGTTSCLKNPFSKYDCGASINSTSCDFCMICDNDYMLLKLGCGNVPGDMNEGPFFTRYTLDECTYLNDAQDSVWQWWHYDVKLCREVNMDDLPTLPPAQPSCVNRTIDLEQEHPSIVEAYQKVLDDYYRVELEVLNAPFCVSSPTNAACVLDFPKRYPKSFLPFQKACEQVDGRFVRTSVTVECQGSEQGQVYYILSNMPQCAAKSCDTAQDDDELLQDFLNLALVIPEALEYYYEPERLKCEIIQSKIDDATRITPEPNIGPSNVELVQYACPTLQEALPSALALMQNGTTCDCPSIKNTNVPGIIAQGLIPIDCQASRPSCWKVRTNRKTFSGTPSISYQMNLTKFGMESFDPFAFTKDCFNYTDGPNVCVEMRQDETGGNGSSCSVTIDGNACSSCSVCDAKLRKLYAECGGDIGTIDQCQSGFDSGEDILRFFRAGNLVFDSSQECDLFEEFAAPTKPPVPRTPAGPVLPTTTAPTEEPISGLPSATGPTAPATLDPSPSASPTLVTSTAVPEATTQAPPTSIALHPSQTTTNAPAPPTPAPTTPKPASTAPTPNPTARATAGPSSFAPPSLKPTAAPYLSNDPSPTTPPPTSDTELGGTNESMPAAGAEAEAAVPPSPSSAFVRTGGMLWTPSAMMMLQLAATMIAWMM